MKSKLSYKEYISKNENTKFADGSLQRITLQTRLRRRILKSDSFVY